MASQIFVDALHIVFFNYNMATSIPIIKKTNYNRRAERIFVRTDDFAFGSLGAFYPMRKKAF